MKLFYFTESCEESCINVHCRGEKEVINKLVIYSSTVQFYIHIHVLFLGLIQSLLPVYRFENVATCRILRNKQLYIKWTTIIYAVVVNPLKLRSEFNLIFI